MSSQRSRRVTTGKPSAGRLGIASLIVLLPLAAMFVAIQSPAASGAPINPLGINRGFTVVAFDDAHFNNAETEGSIAVGGDISFGKGYPVVHTTGLTPPGYTLPVIDGDPTRVLVGGRFLPSESQGVTPINSNGSDTELGYLKLGDLSNVSVNPRGSAGLWISASGTLAGDEPAIEVAERIAQPEESLHSPDGFSTAFGAAQATARAQASLMSECAAGVPVTLEPGSHGGERIVTITEGQTNVLTVSADELGDFQIAVEGGTLGPSTVLLVNITGSPSSVRLPGFADVTSPNASNPNPLAPYVLWNLGDHTRPVEVTGNLISGSLYAPDADLTLNANSPLEGQLVSGKLTTAGGEIHHYAFAGAIECDDEEPTTTSTTEATTTSTTEATTTSTTEPTTTSTTEATTTSTTEATTTSTEDTTTTSEGTTTTTEPTTTSEETTTTTEATTTTLDEGVQGSSEGGGGAGGTGVGSTELSRTGSDSPRTLLVIGSLSILFGTAVVGARRIFS